MGGDLVVAIIDPDFIFLRKLHTGHVGAQFANRQHMLWSKAAPNVREEAPTPVDVVEPGRAVAQYYLIGALAMRSAKHHLPPPLNGTWGTNLRSAWEHLALGPPWFVHVSDLRKITKDWFTFTIADYIRTFDHKANLGNLLSEQGSFALALVANGIKTTRLDHFMVSAPDTWGEGFDWLTYRVLDRALPCVDRDDPNRVDFDESVPLPTLLHFCQVSSYDEWYMNKKGASLKTLLRCDAPLLAEVPKEVCSDLSRRFLDPKRHPLQAHVSGRTHIRARLKQRQLLWMIANTLSRINDAILAYRTHACPPGFNTERTLRQHCPASEYKICDDRTT